MSVCCRRNRRTFLTAITATEKGLGEVMKNGMSDRALRMQINAYCDFITNIPDASKRPLSGMLGSHGVSARLMNYLAATGQMPHDSRREVVYEAMTRRLVDVTQDEALARAYMKEAKTKGFGLIVKLVDDCAEKNWNMYDMRGWTYQDYVNNCCPALVTKFHDGRRCDDIDRAAAWLKSSGQGPSKDDTYYGG